MQPMNGVDALKVIKLMESYIKKSAEHASKFYITKNIHLSFEGIKVTFTPDVCGSVYKDLIFDLIRHNCAHRTKYNLSATLVILGQDEEDHLRFTIQLGVVFPMCN